jgi:hypothetical protein
MAEECGRDNPSLNLKTCPLAVSSRWTMSQADELKVLGGAAMFMESFATL